LLGHFEARIRQLLHSESANNADSQLFGTLPDDSEVPVVLAHRRQLPVAARPPRPRGWRAAQVAGYHRSSPGRRVTG
jgi:hypothetical protein